MATKQADVPNAKHWLAWLEEDPTKEIHLECERWVDARAFARMVAGGREVKVAENIRGLVLDDGSAKMGTDVVPNRWQVKWAGVAGSSTNPEHLVARRVRILDGEDLPEGFRPVREIDFA